MAAGAHAERHTDEHDAAGEGFAASQALFEQVVGWLAGEAAAGLTHAELEDRLQRDSRELFRQLLQDHPAPRGALLYPPRSGERLEVMSLGPMAYRTSKEDKGK